MKNKILFFTGLLILCTSLFIVYNRTQASQDNHYHAGFKIYQADQLQDYSKSEYMEILECRIDTDHSNESAVHLHNSIGDVVHVHGKGMTWGDVFDYVELQLHNKQYTAFINQQPVLSVATTFIQPNDSLVLFIDSSKNTIEANRNNPVTLERIKEVESTKEMCGI